MNELEELEKRIIRLVACNNLEVDTPEKIENLDSYEFGFGWALHFVLEVISELKKKNNESCNQIK